MLYSNMPYSEELSGIMRFGDGPPFPGCRSEYDFGAFCVKEIEIRPSSSDSMGAVSAGHITLTGLVAIAIIDKDTYNIFQLGSDSPYAFLRDQDGSVIGASLPDVPTETRPKNIYCVTVRDEQMSTIVEDPWQLRTEYSLRALRWSWDLDLPGLGKTRTEGNSGEWDL